MFPSLSFSLPLSPFLPLLSSPPSLFPLSLPPFPCSFLPSSFSPSFPPSLPLQGLLTGDVSSFPLQLQELREKLLLFMDTHVYPNEHIFYQHQNSSKKWTVYPLMEELKVSSQESNLSFFHLSFSISLYSSFFFPSSSFFLSSAQSSFSRAVESFSSAGNRFIWLLWGGAN